jgi:predicted dehydrogenase
MEPLRFGILGTARIARRLVAEMQGTDGIAVEAIASRDLARAQWYAQQYGIGKAYGDYLSLLADSKVDAVYIPLPPALHIPWVMAAAEAGKHVLCEKPMALDANELQEALDVCRQKNVVWMDATAWLHHARTESMASQLAQSLGQLKQITAAVTFYEPFQSADHRLEAGLGGGCLLDLGWYAVGCGIWATQSKPKILSATGKKKHGVWYRISILLEWPNDITGMVQCGFDISTRKWFEIAGDERSMICDDFTRPWPSRTPRYWLHNRAGEVEQFQIAGNQERRMLSTFCREVRGGVADDGVNSPSLQSLQVQCLRTQQTLDDLARYLAESNPTNE